MAAFVYKVYCLEDLDKRYKVVFSVILYPVSIFSIMKSRFFSSAKAGILEDLEDMRREEAELKRKKAKNKSRK